MKTKPNRLAALATLACGVWLAVPAQSPNSGGIFVLSFQDAVSPGTSHYITTGIDQAIAADASLIILEMDTPGGLDTSMRDIIQAILDSPVPVASFVYPEGARAASAGTYILYASHVAAMAPATATGACTPVSIGGTPESADGTADDSVGDSPDSEPGPDFPEAGTTMERKAINDAVAYIRSLGELRGRNVDWAESCVRASESLSAQAALERGVIDLIASDRNDLLRQLDGRLIGGTRLSLPETALITIVEADWRTKFLSAISNPTVAVFLLSAGIFGLMLEGYNPGAIVPGVVGAICLLVAAYSLAILPVNYAGLALMLLGLVLIVAEFFVPSFGALGIGGVAAFVFGSLILIDTDVPGFEVASSVIASISFSMALLLVGTIWLALKARNRRIVSGVEEMTGLPAEALEDFDGEGQVWVHGERWRARAAMPVTKGQVLTVKKVDGLVLHVESAGNNS